MKPVHCVLVLLFLFSSCHITDPGYVLDRPMTLLYGEKAVLGPDRTLVGFQELLEDSRCPKGWHCFIAGEGKVLISLTPKGHYTAYVTLSVPGCIDEIDSAHAQPVDTLGYSLRLLKLAPYREGSAQYQRFQYSATLLINRK